MLGVGYFIAQSLVYAELHFSAIYSRSGGSAGAAEITISLKYSLLIYTLSVTDYIALTHELL